MLYEAVLRWLSPLPQVRLFPGDRQDREQDPLPREDGDHRQDDAPGPLVPLPAGLVLVPVVHLVSPGRPQVPALRPPEARTPLPAEGHGIGLLAAQAPPGQQHPQEILQRRRRGGLQRRRLLRRGLAEGPLHHIEEGQVRAGDERLFVLLRQPGPELGKHRLRDRRHEAEAEAPAHRPGVFFVFVVVRVAADARRDVRPEPFPVGQDSLPADALLEPDPSAQPPWVFLQPDPLPVSQHGAGILPAHEPFPRAPLLALRPAIAPLPSKVHSRPAVMRHSTKWNFIPTRGIFSTNVLLTKINIIRRNVLNSTIEMELFQQWIFAQTFFFSSITRSEMEEMSQFHSIIQMELF